MQKVRVLLSGRPRLLSEVIRNMIEHQPDMELVGEAADTIGLLRAAGETAVDVVIVTLLDAEGEAQICHRLLAEYPHLRIVTLSAKGETACLYQSGAAGLRIQEPSGASLLDAIRAALR